MNKSEFTDAVVARVKPDDIKCAASADRVIAAVFDVIKDEVASGGKVTISNFGTFEAVERAEKIGHNPRTGESLVIAAKKSPKFVPGKGFKEAVNK